MAYVRRALFGITSGDRANQIRSVPLYCSLADGQAWVAAADHAAAMATDLGLLMLALNDLQESDGLDYINKFYVSIEDVNDAYAPPAFSTEILNSNKIKLTYRTTRASLPVEESVYITQRKSTLIKNTDGKSYNLTSSPFPNLSTQMIATGLSSYGTAITALVEAIPNDI